MDETLDAFLNEINEIVPLKTKDHNEWKECFDSKSGFSYYWNTKTDEVTWEKPPGFIASRSSKSFNGKGAPIFPSVPPEVVNNVKETVKIYKIASNCNTPIVTKFNTTTHNNKSSKTPQKISTNKFRRRSNSDDEKITLISSYGSESESENESEEKSESQLFSGKSNDSDEEIDILSTVKKKAEQLKILGQNNVKKFSKTSNETSSSSKSTVKVPVSGFSLVAGYDSNSEEENESAEDETQEKNHSIEPKTQSHSTLFPIMESPDIKDFIDKDEKTAEPPETKTTENSFDPKNFQRKRRLGINFTPSERNVGHPPPTNYTFEEKRGLGFSGNDSDMPASSNSIKNYTNFKSAGLEFVKQESPKNECSDQKIAIDIEKVSKCYEILHEKLSFLCEGNKDLMPVQIILIQIETLYGALKAEGLKPSYLHDWLEGTNEDLLKLEKDAAPDGWLLQWDRSQKRYYYHNQSTGQGQWEYPHPDVLRQEEAMDISTTPPPSEIEEHALVEVQPPLPPSPPKRSPSPPPPPIISEPEIPDPPRAPKITSLDVNFEQPLPPGVDYSEPSCQVKKVSQDTNDINSAFDTFYSELAAIENTSNSPPPSNVSEQTGKTDSTQEPLPEEPPKKKKKKVKMGQGLSLKKKDVSKLVEKWKNVHKNY